jgi:hypothetical protein
MNPRFSISPMGRLPKWLIPMVLALGGCGEGATVAAFSPAFATDAANPLAAQPFLQQFQPAQVPITLYVADRTCQDFEVRPALVSQATPIEDAIALLLQRQNVTDLVLAGYRIQIEAGTATVDLRLPSNSPEQSPELDRLSLCEQFIVFGSLRQTLLNNLDWQIRDVQFRYQGEEMVF